MSSLRHRTADSAGRHTSFHWTPRRVALAISLAAHLVLAAVLLRIYLPAIASEPVAPRAATSSGAAGGSPNPPRSVPRPSDIDVPKEQIEQSLRSQIAQVETMSDEEKLSELEENLRRLERIADEQSVAGVTEKVASTLGLDTQQYADDKPAAAGAFDHDSAQVDDVTRIRADDGSWKYETVLVDSSGRKLNVEMEGSEGETMYYTFQQMKKYPLAQSIYRSIVMPLLQKMLDESEQPTAEQTTEEWKPEKSAAEEIWGARM